MQFIRSKIKNGIDLLSPAFFTGFTFPDWIRILIRHQWSIDRKYIPRACLATIGTLNTSLLKIFEDRILLRLDDVDEAKWQKPIFVLGLGRSGTTFLFHLLANDPQLCFPSRLDRDNPHTFLTLRKLGFHRILGRIPVSKRYMDNIATGWLTPEEDDIATAILTSSGRRIHRMFPASAIFARSQQDLWQWCEVNDPGFEAALLHFTRKLVYLHKRRLVLKCPSHTADIPRLVKAFPQAQFVTILRNPFSQFRSMRGMHQSRAMQWGSLQQMREPSDEMRLQYAARVLQRYLDTRCLIAPENLLEIKYHDLVDNQRATLERIYRHLHLDLPASQVESRRGHYRPNNHPQLTSELKDRIRSVYRPFVDSGLFDPEELL